MTLKPTPVNSLLITNEHKEYLEKLSLLDFENQQKVKDYAGNELNKIIFYLSTATFVLSISFIGYLKMEIIFPYILIASWICFIVAIGGQMYNHWISKKVAERKQSLINKSRSVGFYQLWQTMTESDVEISKLLKWANMIDKIVIFSLIFGLILLFIFGSNNLLAINNLHTK